MAHPQVSVIMPLYNKAPYVKKGVKSVLAQSFKDWELIVVDDGSTDGSGQIADELLKDRVNCQVIHQQNAGVSAARNRGIEESQGEYVAFLDADDWWEPTFLEEMVKFAVQYPDAGLWASNYIYYKPGKTHVAVKDENIEDCRLMIDDCASVYINYPKLYCKGEMPLWTGAVLLDRSKLDGEMTKWQNGRDGEVFNTQVKLGEDFLLWLRLSLSYPVAFLNKPLAYYNNDIPASLRLTRHLHAPETHMLWHMDDILDSYLKSVVVDVVVVVNIEDWKALFDQLRVKGLLDYWLSDKYHDAAAKELHKVRISLPKIYELPIGLVKAEKILMRVGSYIKQTLIKIIYRWH